MLAATYYEPYYGYYQDKIYTVKLSYNKTLTFEIKSDQYSKQTNVLYLQLVPSNNKNKVMFPALKLEFLESRRDYMIWDWIYEFQAEDFENYKFSLVAAVVYGKGGNKITKFNPGGISPTLPWIVNNGQLPYLVAKKAQIGLYLANKYQDTLAVNLVTGKQLYTFSKASFLSISPNGLYLMQKNNSDSLSLTINKQLPLLGRIYLKASLLKSPKIFFISDSFILFISESDSDPNLDIYRFLGNTFAYQMFSPQFSVSLVSIKPILLFRISKPYFLYQAVF